MGNPNEILGTKTPSMTSMWSQSASELWSILVSLSTLPKSHDKMEGETIIFYLQK
jgi:hypothetical protein